MWTVITEQIVCVYLRYERKENTNPSYFIFQQKNYLKDLFGTTFQEAFT